MSLSLFLYSGRRINQQLQGLVKIMTTCAYQCLADIRQALSIVARKQKRVSGNHPDLRQSIHVHQVFPVEQTN